MVKAAVEKLNQTSASLGEAMYKAAQASQQAEGAATAGAEGAASSEQGTTSGGDDDVVDAEIVDEDKPNDASDAK